MHTDELLESCMQALSKGQDIPPDIARYLARHPQQRAEVEELIVIAQRASKLPPAELSTHSRRVMQARLAERIGVNPSMLDPLPDMTTEAGVQGQEEATHAYASSRTKRWRLLTTTHSPFARLRDHDPTNDEAATAATAATAARIHKAFRDLTPEDIRRYIGDRGEHYLYRFQRFPQWEPVFTLLAAILRSFKRLEKLTNLYL